MNEPYFPDFSEYQARPAMAGGGALNIGWIGDGHSYIKGEVDGSTLKKIFEICRRGSVSFRHYRGCGICEKTEVSFIQNGKRIILGNSEIRIYYQGQIYVSPNMLCHYIKHHKYKPPEQFIEAINKGIWIEDYSCVELDTSLGKMIYKNMLEELSKQNIQSGWYKPFWS